MIFFRRLSLSSSAVTTLLFACLLTIGAADTSRRNRHNEDQDNPSVPFTTLSTGQPFPLVGFGVGNLQHDLIAGRISEALADDKKIFLFDTAHASMNEITVRKGIENGLQASSSSYQGPVHVVTKVWYTHLGYERTKLSVKASLQELSDEQNKDTDIRVHVLLHWPRCDDSIPWMNCEAEEVGLPDEIKNAGPPPHLHKDTAFLESWRALEDIYTGAIDFDGGGGGHLPTVESIGISNFYIDDLQRLGETSNISPHILQGNVFTLLFDKNLMRYCQQRNIHFQAYNVMNGIFYNDIEQVPNAVEALEEVAKQLSERTTTGDIYGLPQVVLKWFVQQHVSVIPRTTSSEHLKENSAAVIGSMPALNQQEFDTVERGVAALLTSNDLAPTLARFVNRQLEGAINLFWINVASGEEVPVKEGLDPGEIYTAWSRRGHKFAVYNLLTNARSEVQVTAYHGQDEHFEL